MTIFYVLLSNAAFVEERFLFCSSFCDYV